MARSNFRSTLTPRDPEHWSATVSEGIASGGNAENFGLMNRNKKTFYVVTSFAILAALFLALWIWVRPSPERDVLTMLNLKNFPTSLRGLHCRGWEEMTAVETIQNCYFEIGQDDFPVLLSGREWLEINKVDFTRDEFKMNEPFQPQQGWMLRFPNTLKHGLARSIRLYRDSSGTRMLLTGPYFNP